MSTGSDFKLRHYPIPVVLDEEEVHDLIYVLERVKYHLNKPAGERG